MGIMREENRRLSEKREMEKERERGGGGGRMGDREWEG
jgi:hypothetical protein